MSGAGAGWNPPVGTPSRTALWVDHYGAELSAAESAALIGAVSKDAVISKRRRLGLLGGALARIDCEAFKDAILPLRECAVRRMRVLRRPPPLPTALPSMVLPLAVDANPRALNERKFGESA